MRYFDKFYEQLMEYRESNGDLCVNSRFMTDDGYRLGARVTAIRNGRIKLTEEQKDILNSINFVWNGKIRGVQEYTFEKYYSAIKRYYDAYGDCLIPQTYIDDKGEKVGLMVTYLRQHKSILNKEQIKMLNEIHFVWNFHNTKTSFEDFCRLHEEFKAKNGHCFIPVKYVTENGIRLGGIANNFRFGKRKVTKEQRAVLDSIGFVWRIRPERARR